VVCGGLEIDVFLSNVNLPPLGAGDRLVWVQGLLDNYSGPATGTYEMDITNLPGCNPRGPDPWCPPAYPFNDYPNHEFFDQPHALYRNPGTPQAFFDANAYLAIENTFDKTLTLYDGISYGYQNYVSPEPGTWILALSVLAAAVVYHAPRTRWSCRNAQTNRR
jgi:hypothetical protein